MANGERAHRKALRGRDYWSRRHPSQCLGWGKYAKRVTHRLERYTGKREAWQEAEYGLE